MDISKFGKGLLPDPPDIRDYKIEVMGAGELVDWSVPFILPEPREHNQESSDACAPFATSSYHEMLKNKHFSRRDLAARVLLPTYGSTLRDNILAVVNQGQATIDEVLDPLHPDIKNMRDKTGVTLHKELDDKEQNGFVINAKDIDTVARAIRDYKGTLFGVYLSNTGWHDEINPRPPFPGEIKIGHAMYGIGYHFHTDMKCIIVHSSFGRADGTPEGTHHHIKEDYFLSDNTFNPWTLIPKEQQIMTNSLLCKREVTKPDGTKGWEYGFYDPDTTGDGLISAMRNRGITPPLLPDGTLDWPGVDSLVSGGIVNIN